MNKKIAVLAVAAGLAASAVALGQDGSVQIYGRANLGLDSYSATGAAAGAAADLKARKRVYDAGSRLGFQGSEGLGSGLKAIFLIESGVNIDTGGTTGQSGSPNPNTGTFSSRVGHVGLESSSLGRLTFGRSHVWWGNGTIEQTGANYLAVGLPQFYGLLGRGMNVGVSRQSNTLQYSAQIGSNALQISYSPGGESQGAGANTNGKLWGVTAQGQWGGIGAGGDWTKMTGNTPAAGSQASSTGQKLRAGWTYQPGGQISILWVKSKQDNGGSTVLALTPVLGAANAVTATNLMGVLPDPAGTSLSLSQTSWGLSWEQLFGNVQALAQWGKVKNITGCTTASACDNTNATTWLLGARYLFSKRTAMYVDYATIRNASNYNMDYIGGWMTSASTSLPPAFGGANVAPGLSAGSVGADPRLFGVGVIHNF